MAQIGQALKSLRDGWGKLYMESGHLVITNEIVETAQEALKAGLTAMKRVRKGSGVYEDVPDHKIRKETAELILAYKFGRPVSRSENLNFTAPAKTKKDEGDLPADVVRRMVAGGVDVNELLLELDKPQSVDEAEPSKEGEDDDVIDF